MRILMISSTFPFPPNRGGTEIRTFNLLRYLQENHQVTLVTQRQSQVTEDQIKELEKFVTKLIIFDAPESPQEIGFKKVINTVLRLTQSLIKATPIYVLHSYSIDIQNLVDEYVETNQCDVITCEHSVNAIYIKPSYRKSVKTVLNMHSLGYAWTRDHLKVKASDNMWRDRFYLPFIYLYEQRFSQQFSDIVVTTQEDQQEVIKFLPNPPKISIVPNGVDLNLFPYRSQDPGGYNLIFVGAMDGTHNIDAGLFFVNQVLPELQKKYPKTTFNIIGARPSKEILALKGRPGINVTGKVPSIVEYLHQSTVSVIPLRTGYGIKNKTLEPMAAGIPVVGSDRALEGLQVDGDNVPLRALRANTIDEYIQAISNLFDNPNLRQELSQNARYLMETEYNWPSVGEHYQQVLLNP
jgi:polysaccharide biosynthesis protein PslH